MNIDLFENVTSEDPRWDAFVASQPHGHHLQSSLWGQLKAAFGWHITRFIATEGNTIVGGAQIITRTLPLHGQIGYISKGPVVLPHRPDVMTALYQRIEAWAHQNWLLVLSIQPPTAAPLNMAPLHTFDYRPSAFYVVPPETVLVDLSLPEDEILARMKQKTRYNIRLAERKGVTIREGTEADLDIFYRLTEITGKRHPIYAYYSPDYYRTAWKLFAPHNSIKLFLAYDNNEPLSALILLAFGKWVVYKWGASSNRQRHKMPNNLLQWTAMQWSKAHGYQHYDMGGLSPSVTRLLKQGLPINKIDDPSAGVVNFKLGFGKAVTFPQSYDNNYGPVPRWFIRKAVALGWKMHYVRKLVRGTRIF